MIRIKSRNVLNNTLLFIKRSSPVGFSLFTSVDILHTVSFFLTANAIRAKTHPTTTATVTDTKHFTIKLSEAEINQQNINTQQ